MQVKCLDKNYDYIIKDKEVIVFNTMFESKTILLFIASILEILIPEPKSFKIPLAIKIILEDSNDIEIDNKLNVKGSKNFQYFIPKEQYYKWEKTYNTAYLIIIIIGMLLSLLLAYSFFFVSKLNLLIGIGFAFLVGITVLMIRRYKREINLINKYEVQDIN